MTQRNKMNMSISLLIAVYTGLQKLSVICLAITVAHINRFWHKWYGESNVDIVSLFEMPYDVV